MSSLVPKGKRGLLNRQAHSQGTEPGTSPVTEERPQDRAQLDLGSGPDLPGQAADLLGDKGTRGQVDKVPSGQATKRTDYEKKGFYVGLRHQDVLDDLAKALRRQGLPDDRSMIVRALIDAAGLRLEAADDGWIGDLADLCRETLPGTTKNGGKV